MIQLTGVGADPEFFLSNGKKIVSAIGKVGGTKKSPKPLSLPGYFIQEDNVLVEMNIPPASSGEELGENIKTGLRLVRDVLPKNHHIVIKASEMMDRRELLSPEACAFGCEPDTIAWTAEEHIATPPLSTLRTASGHLHIGYTNPDIQKTIAIVKIADIYLGLASVILDPDKRRRELYGQAGSFREKPYGVEYRVLSPFWCSDEVLSQWAFKQIEKVIDGVNNNHMNKLSYVDSWDIMTAINFHDETLTNTLLKKYEIKLP